MCCWTRRSVARPTTWRSQRRRLNLVWHRGLFNFFSVATGTSAAAGMHCIGGAVQSSVPFPSPHASSHRTRQPPPPSLIIRTQRDAMVAAVDRATDQTEVLGSQQLTLEWRQSWHRREADDIKVRTESSTEFGSDRDRQIRTGRL